MGDLNLRVGETRGPIDVSGVFEDADDDTLTYGVTSDKPNVADGTVQNGMLTIIAAGTRGTARITVTADDGNGGTASVSFTVTVAEAYTLTAEPGAPSATFVVADLGAYTAKFHLAVGGSEDDVTVTITASAPATGGITITDSDGLIGAGFNQDNDLEGSLTVKATDAGSRAFEIEGECVTPGAMADIAVEDKDLNLVAGGVILCAEPEEPPPPDDTITASECYSITASMAENEAMDEMRDDIEPHERPAHPTNPEMGQDTIEILNGTTDVQITVTSCEEGPVYIRFLDSDGDVFGTDIDECETCEGASGADVVGLDSQQKLEMNLGPTEMDAAMALMYDQYNVITPGDGSDMYLTGKPGMYYQGKFRFMAPCDWEPFQVEVYEKNGKVRQELENDMFSQTLSCVASPKPGPAGLVFEIDSQKPGEGELRFDPVENAIGHTALLIDASNRNIVSTVDPAVSPVAFDNLNNGWTYHIVVIAEGEDDQYTADAVMDYGVSWLGEDDVPLSTDSSADPTRMHPLCQVDDADITALLSDCDAAPMPPAELTAPMNVMATVDDSDPGAASVTVTWGAADNADRYIAVLFDSNFEFDTDHVATHQTDGSVTFTNVPAGTYTAAVISIMDDASGNAEDIDFGVYSVTVN